MCLSPIFYSKRAESFVLPEPDGRREERSEMAAQLAPSLRGDATRRRHEPPKRASQRALLAFGGVPFLEVPSPLPERHRTAKAPPFDEPLPL